MLSFQIHTSMYISHKRLYVFYIIYKIGTNLHEHSHSFTQLVQHLQFLQKIHQDVHKNVWKGYGNDDPFEEHKRYILSNDEFDVALVVDTFCIY